MGKFVDRPKYICAMGGAVATLNALPGVVPILHAAAGCGFNISNAINGGGGYVGSGYCGGQSLPSSNVFEKEIVFGSEGRLEQQILSTMEIAEADIYFVITGCMVEMIGDDAVSVVKRLNKGKRLFAADTGGFRGNSYKGYDIVLSKLFSEYVQTGLEKDERLVNLWGIVPVQDVYWKGNLRVLKKLVEGLGYKVNTFFGEDETLEDLKESSKAILNIVVSDTYGIDAAKTFKEVHDTDYITTDFPIGDHGTARFIKEVGTALGASNEVINALIKKERKRYYGYLERVVDAYSDFDLQRYAVIVGDANYTQGLTRFLSDDLGWLPELVIINDLLEEEQKEFLRRKFSDYESGIKPELVFDTDASSVLKHINRHWEVNKNPRYYDSMTPAFLIGSSFEKETAQKIKAQHLSVMYPVSNRVVLDRAYAGFEGALTLTEDIFSVLLESR